MGIIITEEIVDTIDNYLKGKLSVNETLAFEKQLQNDSELAELVSIQQNLFALQEFETTNKISNGKATAGIQHYKNKIQEEETQKLFQIVKQIGHKNENNKIKNKSFSLVYYIAASIVIVLGASLYFNANSGLEHYYEENVNWSELPSYTNKGNDGYSNFTNGEILFREKKYTEAIFTLEKMQPSEEWYPYALLYLGACYEQLNQNDKALFYFQKVSNINNFEENSRGYWCQLLVYLKMDNAHKAKELKTLILKDANNYNYEKVKELNF